LVKDRLSSLSNLSFSLLAEMWWESRLALGCRSWSCFLDDLGWSLAWLEGLADLVLWRRHVWAWLGGSLLDVVGILLWRRGREAKPDFVHGLEGGRCTWSTEWWLAIVAVGRGLLVEGGLVAVAVEGLLGVAGCVIGRDVGGVLGFVEWGLGTLLVKPLEPLWDLKD
jgi:hypothetical protein